MGGSPTRATAVLNFRLLPPLGTEQSKERNVCKKIVNLSEVTYGINAKSAKSVFLSERSKGEGKGKEEEGKEDSRNEQIKGWSKKKNDGCVVQSSPVSATEAVGPLVQVEFLDGFVDDAFDARLGDAAEPRVHREQFFGSEALHQGVKLMKTRKKNNDLRAK